jgi:hypothetical protein
VNPDLMLKVLGITIDDLEENVAWVWFVAEEQFNVKAKAIIRQRTGDSNW